ncbi:hypothetical protein ABT126_03735 [Streptomyces sp. NPDC002012]|uniref:hypothetical protein n=1 Tax=unclassified Streptomyces TaxID=2593676 RepID=UPI00332EF667
MRSPRNGVLLLLAAVLALLLGSAGTAQAHPFGTPPVVKIEAAGTAVDATWSAQRDDIAVLKNESGGDEAGYLRSHIVVRAYAHRRRPDRAARPGRAAGPCLPLPDAADVDAEGSTARGFGGGGRRDGGLGGRRRPPSRSVISVAL